MTIWVDNSKCLVTEYTQEEYVNLKNLMSYYIDQPGSYTARKWGPKKKSLLKKNGSKGSTFPTGLLYIARKAYPEASVHDLRTLPPKIDYPVFKLPVTPYKAQLAVVRACKTNSRGIVVAPTGTGKSIMLAMMIKEISRPTMVVVPTLELKRQLTESLVSIFGSKYVGPNRQITVDNIDSLDPGIKSHYDCVIIDEFHHSGADSYRKMNELSWTNVYFKYGLTATPFRSQDNEKLLLESVLSEVIYKVEYKDAVESKLIVPMEAYYITVPKKKDVKGMMWQEIYKELVVFNEERNALVSLFITMAQHTNKSTLVLVKEIAHGEILAKTTGAPFANGLADDTKDLIRSFSAKEIPVLIGTTGVLGEGIDTKPAEYIVIAGLGKSKNSIMQQVGRGFRNYPGKTSCKIILFKDLSHKWTIGHYREQCKVLKTEYGIVPAELET